MSWITRVPALSRQLRAGKPMPWLERHPRRQYLISLFLSCPPWVTVADLKKLDEEARLKTRTTGVQHVVDHIVPVTHPLVSGLTVPWNLRVIDSGLNARKSNKLHFAFQGEMFTQPEQLRIL